MTDHPKHKALAHPDGFLIAGRSVLVPRDVTSASYSLARAYAAEHGLKFALTDTDAAQLLPQPDSDPKATWQDRILNRFKQD